VSRDSEIRTRAAKGNFLAGCPTSLIQRELRVQPTIASSDPGAVGIPGHLATIARDLVIQVQANLKKDWISREPVRARLRATNKRLLARYNYPPDQEAKAIDLVIRQMEHFADVWSTNGMSD
jgi:hypothetical protein